MSSHDPVELPAGLAFAYKAPGVVTIEPDGAVLLTFFTASLPSSGCPSVRLFVSVNEGGTWGAVGTGAAVPVDA